MTIKIKPSDLISRFIWDKYLYFCLDKMGSTEINQLIEQDLEFEISEQDAFVIGLTNVLYTGDVVHKFKQFLLDILNNKNVEFENRLYINKALFLESINTFKYKIPKTWTSDDAEFNHHLDKLQDIYPIFIDAVNNLLITKIQEWPCIKCGQVKKLINKI